MSRIITILRRALASMRPVPVRANRRMRPAGLPRLRQSGLITADIT